MLVKTVVVVFKVVVANSTLTDGEVVSSSIFFVMGYDSEAAGVEGGGSTATDGDMSMPMPMSVVSYVAAATPTRARISFRKAMVSC